MENNNYQKFEVRDENPSCKDVPFPKFRRFEEVAKGWGKEVVLASFKEYCGKLLCFNKGALISGHQHLEKHESFAIFRGSFEFYYFDYNTAQQYKSILTEGDIVDIPRGTLHQLKALEDSIIIEVSTEDKKSDSYRVFPGDSQTSQPINNAI